MTLFQNILFVVEESSISQEAIKKTVSIKKSHNAKLVFLVLHKKFPTAYIEARDAYRASIEKEIQDICAALGESITEINFETSAPHFVAVIKSVINNGHDLVVKTATPIDQNSKIGFKSLDMSLLRKCGCPIWLIRDNLKDDQPKILTAIDPFADSQEGKDLNIKLLKMGNTICSHLEGTHIVISCWDFEYESFLRNSPFAKMPETAVDELIQSEDKRHLNACVQTIQDSGIDIQPEHTVRERGQASEIIPSFVTENNIDIIVMGTVGRTGIPGFFIGNTAENVLQKISCSMLAAKPDGFVSPVKAN